MSPGDLDELLRALASAPPMPLERLAPGQRLGPYLIEAPLGRGGMGRVFRATDTRLGRAVAIKVLDRAGPEAREALMREARAAAAVDHPALVTVYDVGATDDGTGYVAMELIDGAPLSEVVGPPGATDGADARRAAGRLDDAARRMHDAEAERSAGRVSGADGRRPARGVDDAEALRLARAIAGGLAHLHARGLVHRDLKPSNVVIGADGRVKLVDFGLAGRVTDPAGRGGTPHYAAPEVRRGARVDARADVYAFGVLLRWLGSGETDGRAPPRLRALAEACTAEDPEARPADGGALVVALERLGRRRLRPLWAVPVLAAGAIAALTAFGGESTAPPASPAEPERRWTRLTHLDSSALLFEGVIAPDGARLAYAERRGVFVRDLGSGEVTRIADGELGAHCVAWSGDGARLFVGAGDAVRVARFGERAAPSLELAVEGGGCPVPSPDGRWLAIERSDRLELIDLERPAGSSAEPRVLIDAPLLLVSAAWSPRSDRLAAIRVHIGDDGAPTAELSVHRVDGASRVIHSDPGFLMPTRGVSLAWLDEGSLLVGHDPSGVEGEPRELLRTPAERWAPTRHATLPFDPCRLSIDEGGRVTATSHEQENALVVAPVGDGDALSEPRRISRSLGVLEPSDWASDGAAVLGVERTHGASFRAVSQPLDDRPPEALPTGGAATWPVRSAGGALVFWRPPRRAVGPTELIWRGPNGRERVLAEVEESPGAASGWRRPPPVGHWVRCDPSAPRCVLMSAGDAARLTLLDVPSGDVRAARALGDTHPLASFAARWDAEPLLAIPTLDEGRIALVRLDGTDAPARQLELPEGCRAQRVEWNAAGDALFVTGWCDPPAPYRILRVGLDGDVRHLVRESERWLGVPRLSPDGRSLALYSHEFRSNIWRAE